MLIILTIILLMAVATAVVAYFSDLVPSAFDNGTQLTSNASLVVTVAD